MARPLAPAISAKGRGSRHGIRGRSGAGLGETLDAAPHSGLAQGRTSDAKPASILRAGGQGNVMRGNSAGPQSGPLARVSHPIERASEKRASDLSPLKRSIPKRQTKG
jgi:hypothetical protein